MAETSSNTGRSPRETAPGPDAGGDHSPLSGTRDARGSPRRTPWFRLALLALVLSIGGWAFWKAAVAPNLFPRNFGVVEPGHIYRSGRLTPAALERTVRKYGLKTIIDFGGYTPSSDQDRREQRTAEALGVKRYVLRLEGDGTGNPNNYVEALRLMNDPANQPVLVHCSAGTQRTGCAVLLYRHIVQGQPVKAGFVEAERFDHRFSDNPDMLIMVAEFGDEIARAYREGGWIAGHPAPDAAPAGAAAPTLTSDTPHTAPTIQ